MTSRADVVAEARRWVGTPFHHQARTLGVGCDCGGLVGGVAVALGIIAADWWRTVFDRAWAGYGRQPAHGALRAICEELMLPVDTYRPGDVLLMSFLREPQHLAIVGEVDDRPTLIHAFQPAGQVIEHGLDPKWTRRIVAAYGYPWID